MTGSECITGYVCGSTKLAYVECLALCLMYKKELSKYSSLKRIFFLHIIMQILFVSSTRKHNHEGQGTLLWSSKFNHCNSIKIK